ncbi:AMP-binding protein [Nocardioides luteus]|uniref:AMP-binding protein n=1 Tax=Nocardioides luteus TaxID=1844 RepID=UPI001E41045B|nr:AMP-binding protein [Nocardioides luteus]
MDLGGGTIGGLIARRAASLPNKVALITPDGELTYAELDAARRGVTAGLQGLNLPTGSAVAVMMGNRAEWVTAWLGTVSAGLVCVPVNTAYKGTFLEHALTLTSATTIITEPKFLPALAAVADQTDLRHVVVVDDATQEVPGARVMGFDEIILKGGSGSEEPVATKPSDTAVVALTSGTTGKSKGVVTSHLMQLVAARENAECLLTTTRDTLYTCLPMFHGAAQINICLHGFYLGATVVLAERFSASRFWDDVRRHGVTVFNALGSVLPMLLAQPPRTNDRDNRVRVVFAAPAPPEVLLPFEDRFGVHVVEGYGLTEIKNVTYNPIDARRVGSIGKPTRTTELAIHDDDGNALGPGEIGEIVYRPKVANVMFNEYLGNPESTLETMRGLWWHTGDLGYVDADGFYWFVDRKKDALRRRGENISSYEVEAVLLSYPGILAAAAVGTPSELGEDEVLAVVEVDDTSTVDYPSLFRHCDDHLPHFMVPRYYRAVEAFPRTPTGKIQKSVLRSEGVDNHTWDADAAGHEATRIR